MKNQTVVDDRERWLLSLDADFNLSELMDDLNHDKEPSFEIVEPHKRVSDIGT